MSDTPALDKRETLMVTPVPQAVSRQIYLARYISTIFSPMVISLPFIVLVALYRTPNILMSCLYAGIAFFFLSVGPMIYILRGVRKGTFTDTDVSVRSQRIGPYLFGITSALAGLFALFFIHGPKNLETLLLITVVSGIIMMLVTLWWKISIHASSMAAAVTMLTTLYGNVILPAFVVLVAICWSRIVLRRHTLGQVVAGSLVGAGLTILVLTIRGV